MAGLREPHEAAKVPNKPKPQEKPAKPAKRGNEREAPKPAKTAKVAKGAKGGADINTTGEICRAFRTTGRCSYGEKCKHKHIEKEDESDAEDVRERE